MVRSFGLIRQRSAWCHDHEATLDLEEGDSISGHWQELQSSAVDL
jgi:hypothetical protein